MAKSAAGKSKANQSERIRRSPFYDATVRYGATGFTVYNHMWMPTAYGPVARTYKALTERVTIWDTAAERQVEIQGPDALALMRLLTPRNLDNWTVGGCKYVLLCDRHGGVINDPVALKLAEDRYWLSIADADMLYWVSGLALGRDLDVEVSEPDVSPLQVQGPLATELMRDLVGDWIEELRFFRFVETEIETAAGPAPVIISRTGWSNERGYELFLRDSRFGDALWERCFELGARYDAAPGCPNQANRIEAGMLSHRADMDHTVNPFELGMDRLVDLEQPVDFVGRKALARIAEEGVRRKLVGLRIAGAGKGMGGGQLALTAPDGAEGVVTSHAWSPRLRGVIGLGFAPVDHARDGETLTVHAAGGARQAVVSPTPFVQTSKRAAPIQQSVAA